MMEIAEAGGYSCGNLTTAHSHSDALVRRQLEAAFQAFELDAGAGRLNTLCAAFAVSAAAILGARDLAGRALDLLRSASDVDYFADAITNISAPIRLHRERNLGTDEELATKHPILSEQGLPYKPAFVAHTELLVREIAEAIEALPVIEFGEAHLEGTWIWEYDLHGVPNPGRLILMLPAADDRSTIV